MLYVEIWTFYCNSCLSDYSVIFFDYIIRKPLDNGIIVKFFQLLMPGIEFIAVSP